MATHWICRNGHRWEDAAAGPLPGNLSILCPVCGAEGSGMPPKVPPASQSPAQPLEALLPDPAHGETLHPNQPLPTSGLRPPTRAPEKPFGPDETLDKPAPDPTAETLAPPPGRPTAARRRETAGPSGLD